MIELDITWPAANEQTRVEIFYATDANGVQAIGDQ